MRNPIGAVVFSAFACLAGCNTPPPATRPAAVETAAFGGWSWYVPNEFEAAADDVGVSAAWGSWETKFVYLILADIDTTATTSINTSGARTEYLVTLTSPGARKAEVRVETADGKTGRAVHAGRSYDLARGSVFVLLPEGERFKMLQLEREVSDVAAGVPGLSRLVRTDQEIVRMFARLK